MRLRLTLICGDPVLARAAIAGGIDRVLVDLERRGKAERQHGRSLFLSGHEWKDVERLRDVLPGGALVVRLDPLHDETAVQVARAIALGADALMLPWFHDAQTVLRFCDLVGDGARVLPLVETRGAVGTLGQLLSTRAIAEFHVGLNDLALDMGYASLKSLWGDPVLDQIATTAKRNDAEFGIGGVTDPRVRGLPVDPVWVIAEQKRLGSTYALLGRSFRASHEREADENRIRVAVDAIQAVYRTAHLDPS